MTGWGQTVEIGLDAGVPLTQSLETGTFLRIDFGESATSATRRYTVGPMVRIALPRGFSVEGDALYKRIGFDDYQRVAGYLNYNTREIDNSWEFPVLGTYRFLRRLPAKPVASAGPAFRITETSSNSTTGGTQVDPYLYANQNQVDFLRG